MLIINKQRVMIYVVLLFFIKVGCGQQLSSQSESLINQTDSVIRQEISTFTLRGLNNRYSAQPKLEEITLTRCSDSFAHFEKGNIVMLETAVDIIADANGNISNVSYVHYKYGFAFPKNAYSDIGNARLCMQYSKKNKPISSDCKVFRSEDGKRVYVYMLNGEADDKYEITWVIQDSKYFTRVIDCCF